MHKESKHEVKVHTCDQCSFTSSYTSHLSQHIRSVHSGTTFNCDKCETTTESKLLLLEHMNYKHEECSEHSCTDCDFVSLDQGAYRAHVKYAHTSNRYPCDQCSFSATNKSRLKEHKDVQHNGVRFPCDQCEYVATRTGNLKQHKAAKHLGVRYPCDLCDYVSTQSGNLKQHRAVKHGCESRYTCNQCEYVATDRPDLTKHKGEKHKESILNDNVAPRFPCDQCEYVATQLGNLKTHKESIHQGIKYPCDQCDYVASQLGNLKQHKESKHEGVRHPCDQCSHSSTTKGHLKMHKDTVHIGIEYLCDKCELKFKSVKALRFHREAKHEGITYPCLSCEYIASTKALLKKHTESRHDGITYSCNLCTYTTNRNEYLKRHKKYKHTNQDLETKPPPPVPPPPDPPVVQNPYLNPRADPILSMFLRHAAVPKAVSDTLLNSNNPDIQAETAPSSSTNFPFYSHRGGYHHLDHQNRNQVHNNRLLSEQIPDHSVGDSHGASQPVRAYSADLTAHSDREHFLEQFARSYNQASTQAQNYSTRGLVDPAFRGGNTTLDQSSRGHEQLNRGQDFSVLSYGLDHASRDQMSGHLGRGPEHQRGHIPEYPFPFPFFNHLHQSMAQFMPDTSNNVIQPGAGLLNHQAVGSDAAAAAFIDTVLEE